MSDSGAVFKLLHLTKRLIVFLGLVALGQNCAPPKHSQREEDNSIAKSVYSCTQPESRGIGTEQMRRLNTSEIKNTIRDLVGTTIYNDIEPKLSGLPSDVLLSTIAETNNVPASTLPLIIFNISQRASEMMIANLTLRATVLGSCAVNVTVTDECVRSVSRYFGRRVLRRAVTAAETEEHLAFYKSMGGNSEALNYLFMRLLQSPSLAFHMEFGSTKSNGRVRLTDFEIASRISYRTANTMPDEALLNAADKNELQNIETVRSHVIRLLEKSEARTKTQDFFRYYTKMNVIDMPPAAVLSEFGIAGTGLPAEMRQEANDFINYIVWTTSGTFENLMTSPVSFPKTSAMAKILQVGTALNQPVSISPSHIGLLHRPALLSSSSRRTSPIIRGAHIRKLVLCDQLDDPPTAEVQAREEEVGDLDDLSNRIGVDHLTNDSQCIKCHKLINNLGYAFENYSQLGAFRTQENVYDASNNIKRTFSIDTNVSNPYIEAGGPTSLTGSRDLAQVLAKSNKARACFAKKMFEYYTYRAAMNTVDGCALAEAEEVAKAESIQSLIIKTIANEDIFWRKEQ